MKINIDFRLLDVTSELHVLEDYYYIIEKQILQLSSAAKSSLDEYRRKENLTPEDGEWHIAGQEYDHKVEVLLPRLFWGPFIVSLYAVLETSVIEIARLIQQTQKQRISINDQSGRDFLERAKRYYNLVLKFELPGDKIVWHHLDNLTQIRHAIAHANGRLDMSKDKVRKKIEALEKKNIGISSDYNYLLVDSSFAKESLSAVSSVLQCLVERYKEWDTHQKKG